MAALVLVSGFVLPAWRWAGWLLAVGLLLLSTAFGRERGFSLRPEHFVERHGLVMIIALGESIVSIGVGAAGAGALGGAVVELLRRR